MKTDWYTPLREVSSRGKTTAKAKDLAGLHDARKAHLGQFWTPEELVGFLWGLVGMDQPLPPREDGYPQARITVLDNSFGSGRMFAPAHPERHILYGIELDAAVAAPVREAVKAAGFEYRLEQGSMEEFRFEGEIDVAFLNPPFSINLDSEAVEPLACNSFGKYGPRSSCLTHRYAIAQALKWSKVVVAVVPRTFAQQAKAEEFFSKRLRAVYHLPGKSFVDEGADVATSALVWGEDTRDPDTAIIEEPIISLSARRRVPNIDVCPDRMAWYGLRDFTRWGRDDDARAVITEPVTGDRKVRICHNGRRIVLKFGCGAARGRVMNAVLNDRVSRYRGKKDGRLPAEVVYSGQGALDLENYIVQTDPVRALKSLADRIEKLGYEPKIDAGVLNYLRRRTRQYKLLVTPLRHNAMLGDGGLRSWLEKQKKITGVAKVEFNIFGSQSWYGGRGIVKSGDTVVLEQSGKRWSGTHQQCMGSMEESELRARFDFPEFVPEPNAWKTIHEGLHRKFPKRFHEATVIARRLGLDKWCSWDFQFHDLCEVALRQGNTVVGWDMGLGKCRLSLALCYLLQGKHNLITVEAHLVEEMKKEIKLLEIPKDDWQVITDPSHLKSLRRINVISISRLKAAVDKEHPKTTYAKRLRRRISTHVTDECQMLRNPDTDQSRAVTTVSAKHRYGLSGTPIANYPRDILPLMQWVAGDGTAHQPYGDVHPHLTTANVTTLDNAVRGVDRFREMFITLEWVTNEFADDLRSGAKREIPKIKDVSGFREMVAPILKRRIMEEPEVSKHVHTPRAIERTTEVEWDTDHLIYYYRAAEEFVDWFKNLGQYERKNNLVAILAKIQAVHTACNFPQAGVANLGSYTRNTSKQRHAIQRLRQLTDEGHKTIFYCHSPAVVDYIGDQLAGWGCPSIRFHGGHTITHRNKLMDEFREGDCPNLLATKGVLQTGYNIWQADRILCYDRAWTPKIEQQAIARVLRPQQTRTVEVEFMHLKGSIDEYQGQMCHFKADTMRAGLDFGEEDPEAEFLHIETILGRFVTDFEGRVGTKLQTIIKTHKPAVSSRGKLRLCV